MRFIIYTQLFFLILLNMACASEQPEALSFADCVGQNKKWDFASSQCLPGRTWEYVPSEMKRDLDRPLNEQELILAAKEMGAASPDTLAKSKAPQAVIMIGAGASGKSTLAKRLFVYFPDVNLKHFVQFDGDILRAHHQGYQQTLKDDAIGYIDGWKILKPNIFKTKEMLLPKIIEERRNILVPTGRAQDYFDILKEAGYEITIVGLYVDHELAALRGKNRSQWTGRYYLGTEKHWEESVYDMNKLARDPKASRAIIIDNTDFYNPKIKYIKAGNGNTGLTHDAIPRSM